MPVIVRDGKRLVEFRVEVPGSQDEVFEAIATGRGMSSWFGPAHLEERAGGALVLDLGGGMISRGEVLAWEPPHRMAYVEKEWMPGAPPCYTECSVSIASEDSCFFDMTNRFELDTAEWDYMLECFEQGWPTYFTILRARMLYFRGMECGAWRGMGFSETSEDESWHTVKNSLGFEDLFKQKKIAFSSPGGEKYSGEIIELGTPKQPNQVLIRLERPSPGIALFAASAFEGTVHVLAALYFYGPDAGALAAREEAHWLRWLGTHFLREPSKH